MNSDVPITLSEHVPKLVIDFLLDVEDRVAARMTRPLVSLFDVGKKESVLQPKQQKPSAKKTVTKPSVEEGFANNRDSN